MTLEIGIIALGLLALVGDLITSRLLMPQLRIDGQRSRLYAEEKARLNCGEEATEASGMLEGERLRVYQFAFQSDEAKVLEWDNAAARLLIEIRGPGTFRPLPPWPQLDSLETGSPLLGYLGPDEFPAEWVEQDKSIAVFAQRVRPHKTWVFRCFVSRDVEEMALTLQVPSRWPIRRFLMRLSRNLFLYAGPFWNEKRIVVRQHEDKALTRGFKNTRAELGVRLVVLASAGGLVYYFALKQFSARFFSLPMEVGKLEAVGVGIILFLMLVVLYRLSVRDSLPIAQGYHSWKLLKIRAVASRDK